MIRGWQLLGLDGQPPYMEGLGYGPHNLQGRDFNDAMLLDELLGRGEATVTGLALATDHDGRTVAGAMRRLEKRGVVELVPDDEAEWVRETEAEDFGKRPRTGVWRVTGAALWRPGGGR